MVEDALLLVVLEVLLQVGEGLKLVVEEDGAGVIGVDVGS